MKKLFQIFSVMIVLVIAGGMFSACEGPEGAQGPEGPAGQNGANALASCDNCHDVGTDLKAKMLQYASSTHALGGNFERNDADCAPCHTHEGFINVLTTGETGVAHNPTPPGCRTCHNIHTTYTVDDYALTTSAPVQLILGDKTYDKGSSNLCANCHQSRNVNMPSIADTAYNITNSRFGPHHGPQANLMVAAGLVEFDGSESYSANNIHGATGNGCIDCHMADAYGVQAGGHNMSMAYDYHGVTEYLTAGCTNCHGTDSDLIVKKIEDYVVEIDALMAQLKDKLEAAGVMNDGATVTGKTSGKLAAALLNYRTIEEDRSNGIHNPRYTKAILKNTIAAL